MKRKDIKKPFYPYQDILMDMHRRITNSMLEIDIYNRMEEDDKALERQLNIQNKRIITGDEPELAHLFI